MLRSYGLGIGIVMATILAAAAICAPIFSKQVAPPAGETLGSSGSTLGDFNLIERSGRPIRSNDLGSGVWIASLIFTRCPSSCPLITNTMKGLQHELSGSQIRLVSISVDPDFDTTEVLSKYADNYLADRERWWFLTGRKSDIYKLILEQFYISVGTSSEEERQAGAEDVAHSDRLILLSRGNRVVGTYLSRDIDAVNRLARDARLLETEGTWPRWLPEINASLNATCSVLLMLAWSFILTKYRRLHALTMVFAIAVSSLFLACYLIYHFMVGSMPFRGYGPIRVVYFTILLSHTVLATFGVVPLLVVTLFLASKQRFQDHARIARVTFPIWLYVSVTGVVIYWMLYRLDVSPSLG